MPNPPAILLVLALSAGLGSCLGTGSPREVAAPAAGPVDLRPQSTAPADCTAVAREALLGGPAAVALRSLEPERVIDDLGLPPATPASLCTLEIRPMATLPGASRRELAVEHRQSTYVASVRRRPNPRYRELSRALSAAERPPAASETRVMATGQPLTDLIGSAAELLLTGINHAVRAGEASRLRQQLASTPEEVEEPQTRSYSYDALLIEADREGVVAAALIRGDGSPLLQGASKLREMRRWAVEPGRRSDDAVSPAADSLPDLDALAAWQAAGPAVRVSTVLRDLLDQGPEPASLNADRPDPRPVAGPTALPPQGTLLIIEGEGATALGVRLSATQAVALAGAVGRSALVEVRGLAGPAAFALVQHPEQTPGLAVMDLPASSLPPAQLAAPAPGPAAALVIEAGRMIPRPGRLAPAGDGRLHWWSEQAAVVPPGAPVIGPSGVVLGLLADDAGTLIATPAFRPLISAMP
jgi:hypothetical protein